MGNFIRGILERNDVTGEYQGNVYERELVLNHSNRFSLKIFDGIPCISDHLAPGGIVEVILVPAVITSVEYFAYPPPQVEPDKMSGVVIALDWVPPSNYFKESKPRLYKNSYGNDQHWLLIRTELGELLMNSSYIKKKFQIPIQKGEWMQWKALRTDLYAIA